MAEHKKFTSIGFVWLVIVMAFMSVSCAPKPDDKALGLAKLDLTPASQAINVGESFQYSAAFVDARGDEQDMVMVTWSTSDTAIASISMDGEVMGVAVGQAKISATVESENSGTTESNVVFLTVLDDPNAVAKVQITNTESAFFVDDSVQLASNVSKLDGSMLNDKTILWSSSDETIATVDVNGLVQIVATGTATLTAMVDNIASPGFQITVRVKDNTRVATFQAAAHDASGKATLKVNSEGKLEIVFSGEFTIDNGPGLEVFLSNTQTPNQSSVNLGKLKSISGAQTYAVPGSIMIDDYEWVIVHCVPFNIVFGRAQFP